MKMPPVRGSHFAQVPKVEIPRSQFDRSHGYKTTFDAGYLVPVLVDEVLPGDTVNVRMAGFARLATPIKPIMDNLTLDSFFFFVPNRLIWDNFEKFMGAQDVPGASTDYLVPKVAALNVSQHTLFDYMGLPMLGAVTNVGEVNALPFRAYNLIYNEWFRDQNLQSKVVVPVGDGPDAQSTFAMYRRGKRADYFTTCLPWPQKGTAVQIPVVSGASAANVVPAVTNAHPTFKSSAGATGKELQFGATTAAGAVNFGGGSGTTALNSRMNWDTPNLRLDPTALGTINQLRQAVQIQRLLEREARGGTRYIEWTKAVFGVTNPDFRLQRPEYLGGGSSPVVVSPIAQTTASPTTPTGKDAQGNLAGVGTVSWQSHGFAKSFTEHGYIIGLVNVRADLTYQRSLERMWTRSTKYDLAMPVTAHLGEQAVLSKEVWFTGTPATDDAVFGYQERFAEYRFKQSLITGLFRSNAPGTLDFWHLAENWGTGAPPTLSPTFIMSDPPVDRVIAVPTEPHFLLDAWFDAKWARCLPTFGVPGMMDHF